MLSYSWDTTWEAQPAIGLSRNSLDDHLRRTTLGVRERMEREHDWGPYSDDDSGEHLPGLVSAILTGDAAARGAVSDMQEGSVFFQNDGTNLTIWLYTSSAWVEITDDDHDHLENLSEDNCHTQYMLKDGTYTDAAATLDMNGNKLSTLAASGLPLVSEHPYELDPHAGVLAASAIDDDTLRFWQSIDGAYLTTWYTSHTKAGSPEGVVITLPSDTRAIAYFSMRCESGHDGDWQYGCTADWGFPNIVIYESSIFVKTVWYKLGVITTS